MTQLRKAINSAIPLVTIIGAVFGFIGDVLEPLGNFAVPVAALSFAAALVTFVLFIVMRRRKGDEAWESPVAAALVISTASTVIFTFWSLVFASAPERGYLASNIEPIAQIQAQLLGLQKDVGEIKQTTQLTATQVAVSATQIVVSATSQAQGFADIQAAFAALQSGQGLIQNPKTPQEWYSNARLYQLRGDTANAIKSYEGYLSFKLEYVDPLQQYVALLKASEGIARTRQIIRDLLNGRPESQTLELTLAQLLDTSAERLERLTALAARAPQYGPVFYALGDEYTRALGTTATRDLLQKQADAFSTLFKLEEQQLFTRYYIDKAQAESQLENARKLHAAYAGAQTALSKVDVQILHYSQGTSFFINIAEIATVQKILFSIDDPQPKTDTGRNAAGFANISIQGVLLPVGDHTFYMQYVDANGVSSPVFSQPFRVDPITVVFSQQPTDFSTNTIPGSFLVGILGEKPEAAKRYTYDYSLDSKALDQHVSGFYQLAIPVTGLKPGDHTFYVQATGEDGKKTDVVAFKFTVK